MLAEGDCVEVYKRNNFFLPIRGNKLYKQITVV
jgi:hypothetical protein